MLTVGTQVFGLLLSLSVFYYYTISVTIPSYIEIVKFRKKKLKVAENNSNIINKDIDFNVWVLKYCYKTFLK